MPGSGLYSDPKTTRRLAFVPGLGYLYTGEYVRGFATWVTTIGGLGMGPVLFRLDSCTFALLGPCSPGPRWPYRAAGAFLVIGGAFGYVRSIVDAPKAAARANQRYWHPVAEPAPSGGGAWLLGLTIR